MICPRCGGQIVEHETGSRKASCLACWRTFAILGGIFAHHAANLVETYASRRVDTYTPTPSDQREFGFTKGRKPNG